MISFLKSAFPFCGLAVSVSLSKNIKEKRKRKERKKKKTKREKECTRGFNLNEIERGGIFIRF